MEVCCSVERVSQLLYVNQEKWDPPELILSKTFYLQYSDLSALGVGEDNSCNFSQLQISGKKVWVIASFCLVKIIRVQVPKGPESTFAF